jgi:DNA-binding NtrC family response regulator
VEHRKVLYLDGPTASPSLLPDIHAAGWEVLVARGLEEARQMADDGSLQVGLAPLNVVGPNFQPLEELVQSTSQMAWIALLPESYMNDGNVCELIRDSFYDYHTLPADSDRLLVTLGHAYGMAAIRKKALNHLDGQFEEPQMVGASPAMRELFSGIRKVAPVSAPVLITGESGTGKELTALAIHERSSRASGPFVAVNCGALPASLIQSELFGYEKGAFTGATQRKIGRIEAANGGTIFLDEIGDLPLNLQVNLLRFLQEKTIERVGSNVPIQVDARVIAATHTDLEKAVAEGRFREDLYYRLHVLPIHVPPLRERAGDVEVLAQYFFHKFASENRSNARGFSQNALNMLNNHDWPGNVREMINRIRRALVMCESRLITPADLGLERRVVSRSQLTLEEARIAAEREAIDSALRRARNNVSLAAKELGVSRVTLYRLMEKCGIH